MTRGKRLVVVGLLGGIIGLTLGWGLGVLLDADRGTRAVAIGDCVTGSVDQWPATDLERTTCEDADWEVAGHWWATDAAPLDLESLGSLCPGGRLVGPSAQTWDRGDRTVLCLVPPTAAASR